MSGKGLVYGVGDNDANYVVAPTVEGHRVRCPYYGAWISMLRRCYSENRLQKYPTYIGCTVCEDWKTFSIFRKWMEAQDWVGKDLDKDILVKGNKIYSPETCVFVAANVNTLLIDCTATRGEYMLGCNWHKNTSKFIAQCNDNSGKQVYLGLFTSELDAHLAWRTYKHSLACKLAEEQEDIRIAEALRNRYK